MGRSKLRQQQNRREEGLEELKKRGRKGIRNEV